MASGARRPDCLRAFAFSDLDGELWGAAWLPPGGAETAVVGAGGESGSMTGSLDGADSQEPWGLEGEGTNLVLEGATDPVGDLAGAQPAFDQLVRVRGSMRVAGATRDVNCLGWRSARPSEVLPAGGAGVRQVAAWLAPDEGFALLALRSAKAKGHEADTVSGVMFTPAESKPVIEPRLSTTYAESGQPIRASVELWLQAGEDPDQQYPRRAVGAARQASARWTVDGFTFEALPFHWHASGQQGPGVYLLGQRG